MNALHWPGVIDWRQTSPPLPVVAVVPVAVATAPPALVVLALVAVLLVPPLLALVLGPAPPSVASLLLKALPPQAGAPSRAMTATRSRRVNRVLRVICLPAVLPRPTLPSVHHRRCLGHQAPRTHARRLADRP